MLAQIIFWLSLFLLVYSYILYPTFVNVCFHFFTPKSKPSSNTSFSVFILIAAHNEEDVILQKLRSIDSSDYPKDKLKVYIGSDNSTDKTNDLISAYAEKSKFPIYFEIMKNRSGKIGTINHLVDKINQKYTLTPDDILISTDADVMLQKETVGRLARHFTDPNIGLVDAHIHGETLKEKSVSKSESKYLHREAKLKYQEGQMYGKMMGSFGGCLAIRASCFRPVPSSFRVDDFFLTMHVLSNAYKAISDPEAICTEKVNSTFSEEFKRKRRISSGNFQNMAFYKKYLLPLSSLGFVFFSHKVIRYIGPILMLIVFILNAFLITSGSKLMIFLFAGQLVWYILIPMLDRIFEFFGTNVLALRNVRYFNYMNLALLYGMKDYIYGIDSNIWEPTKRT